MQERFDYSAYQQAQPTQRVPQEQQKQQQGKKKATRSVAETFANIGLILVVTVFGGVFVAINGGFSVRGLQEICGMFNTSGALFWSLMSSVTVPLNVQGQAHILPVLPWVGVLGITVLQCSTLYLKMKDINIPPQLGIATVVASIYDLGSTFSGLGTVEWIASAGWGIQGPLAFFLTFLFELTVSWLIAQRK